MTTGTSTMIASGVEVADGCGVWVVANCPGRAEFGDEASLLPPNQPARLGLQRGAKALTVDVQVGDRSKAPVVRR